MGTDGEACTICTHDKRAAIDVGLVHKVPMAALAERFGVSKDVITRHSHNHFEPGAARGHPGATEANRD